MVSQAGTAIDFQMSERQLLTWRLLHDPSVSEVLFGGARAGAKTYGGCLMSFMAAMEIIQRCGLQPSDHPLQIGFLGRQRGVDFESSVLDSWFRAIPSQYYTVRRNPTEITILNTVKFLCGGLDSRETISRFTGPQFAWWWLDQAEECDLASVSHLRGASNRFMVDSKLVPTKALLTANPRQCWVKEQFISDPIPSRRFVQALPTDNPFIDQKAYVQQLKDAYGHAPEILAAYLDGDWDALSDHNQIIKTQWLNEAYRTQLYPRQSFTLVACDSALYGDDETVIYVGKDTDIIEAEHHGKTSPGEVTARLAALYYKHRADAVVIEEWAGSIATIEQLIDQGIPVLALNPACKSSRPNRWYNQRAEMWMTVAGMFSRGEVALSYDDHALKTQLTALTYELRPGPDGTRFLVESKDDLKLPDRMGRSPDRADTYVLLLYGLHVLRRGKDFRWGPGVKRHWPKPEEAKRPAPDSIRGMRERRMAAASSDRWS